MANKLPKQTIVNNAEVCRCGCHGSDPWHRSLYKRTVTVTGQDEGTVKMPYSTQPVRVTQAYYGDVKLSNLWDVDRDSIVWDKV